jgi:acetoin utilization protein AcuB
MDDSEITKVQELIYTTRVETVMAQNVLVIGPSASTNDARLLMRQKRVTGLPVLENDRLVGIIT